MTGLTDIRDRTLTMLRAIGVEPDDWQMRIVEKYVRWVDRQVSEAHIFTVVTPDDEATS